MNTLCDHFSATSCTESRLSVGRWCKPCRAGWWARNKGSLSPNLRRLYARGKFSFVASEECGDPPPKLTHAGDYAVRTGELFEAAS